MSAPNPWHEDLPPLDSATQLLDGENALDMIREILLEWPGEETVKLSDQERHNRLVRVVAGYPEIDVNRVPLDWPLHPKSIRSLRLSRYLDSISSPNGETSLRSALLNADTYYNAFPSGKFFNVHRRFLSLLIQGLRVENSTGKTDGFSAREVKFLCALHSSENLQMNRWWPWKEMGYLVQKPEDRDVKFKSGELPGHLTESWCTQKDVESIHTEGKVIGVKFSKIQSWIHKWSDRHDRMATGQILMRGASAILESTLSCLRHTIIQRYGVSSILIDGGGRIEFLSSDGDEELIHQAINGVFLLRKGYTPHFNEELKNVAKIISQTDQINQEIFSIYGEGFSKSCLPPYSVYIVDEENEFEKPELSPKFEYNGNSDNCMICSDGIELEGGARNWDLKMEKFDTNVCIFHRLIYFIGKSQRKVESSIRLHGGGMKSNQNKQRTVTNICRLDLNSLGILFKSPFDLTGKIPRDVARRRSFRFNSHWWECIQNVLDDPDYTVDQIAAWIAAGDDIVLAEYQPVETAYTNRLEDVLIKLSDSLHELSEQEFGNLPLSFGAGLCNRKNIKSIRLLLEEATNAEDMAKNRWKTIQFEKGHQHLITNHHGDKKEFIQTGQQEGESIRHNSIWIKVCKD